MFFGIVLLVTNTILVSVALFRWLARKEQPHPVTFLPLVIMPVVYSLSYEIPTRPTVTLYLHRDAFIELADSAVSELRNAGKMGFSLSESPFYKEAWTYRDFSSKALSVEFIIGDDDFPLVYIAADNPSDIYGACFGDGRTIEKLEPNWYVCHRN